MIWVALMTDVELFGLDAGKHHLMNASLHGIKAGGVLTVDGNPTLAAQDMSEYDPFRTVVEEGVTRMLEVVIEALPRIAVDP